jgi:hypothetical protein
MVVPRSTFDPFCTAWASGSDYIDKICREHQTLFCPDTRLPYLYTVVFGISTQGAARPPFLKPTLRFGWLSSVGIKNEMRAIQNVCEIWAGALSLYGSVN